MSLHRSHTGRKALAILTSILLLAQLLIGMSVSPVSAWAAAEANGADAAETEQPGGKTRWVVAGSFQGWSNDSADTRMKHLVGDFYEYDQLLPAGRHEFKLVRSGTWDGFSDNGNNFSFELDAPTLVRFYINEELGEARISLPNVRGLASYTPALDSSQRPRLVGSLQPLWGEAEWSPGEARQFFIDYYFNNTVYKLQRTFPAGSYEAKVVFGSDWNQNDYGAEGGQNLKLVTLDPADVTFTIDYAAASRVLKHNYIARDGSYDGEIDRSGLFFDSRSVTYKKPFGAIAAGRQEVTLRIAAKKDDVQTAKAELKAPDGLSASYPMRRVTSVEDRDYFEVTIPSSTFAGKIGIWGYSFTLVDGPTKVEYGDDGNRGGTGIVSGEGAVPYDLTVYDPDFKTPDWIKHAVVYQIFPDRFFDGNKANNRAKLLDGSRGANSPDYATVKNGQKLQYFDGGVDDDPAASQVWGDWNAIPENPDRLKPENAPYYPGEKSDGAWTNEFYGGDIQGIQQKLGYLKALGVTAVYLNPVAWAASNHKYDATDYKHLDPMFGEPVYLSPGDPTSGLDYAKTREASDRVFQAFAEAAREAGIHLINDGVFNHVGDDSIYFDRYGKYPEIGAYEYWEKVYDRMDATGQSRAEAEVAVRDFFTSQLNPLTGRNYSWPEDFRYVTWFTVEKQKVKNRDDDGLHYKYDAWWGYDSLPVMDAKEPQTEPTEYLPADTLALPGQHEWNSIHYRDQVIGHDLSGKPDGEAQLLMQEVGSQRWLWMGSSGWRLDVAPDVSGGTWQKFREAVKSAAGRSNANGASIPDPVLIGEEWGVATRYLLGDQFDSVMNYRFRGALQSFMESGNAETFHQALESIREDYPAEAWQAMMNLVGSHDTTRSITKYDHPEWEEEHLIKAPEASANALRQQALTAIFQLGYPGAPTIYYGDEVGMTGTKDPDSRRAFPWERVKELGGGAYTAEGVYQELFDTYRKAAEIRHSEPVFRTGELKLAYAKGDTIAYARKNEKKGALLVINRSKTAQTIEADVAGFLPNGLLLSDRLHGEAQAAVAGGKASLTVPAQTGLMLVSTGELQTVDRVKGLSAQGLDGSVELSWQPVAGAEQYQVYRAAIEGGPVILAGTTAGVSFTDTSVVNGTKYYYAVTAAIGSGESLLSDTASATPAYHVNGVGAPSAVTAAVYAGIGRTTGPITVGISVYGLTDNPVYAGKEAPGLLARLAYYKEGTDPADAQDTKLRYQSDSGRSKVYEAAFEPTEAGVYHYYAKASTDQGERFTVSPTVTFEVYADPDDTTPPAAPVLAAFTVESNRAHVNWTPSDDTAAGYDIYRKAGSETTFRKIATLDKTAVSYIDYAVSNDTTYVYRVAAFDQAYNRAFSAEQAVTPRLVMVDVTLRLHIPPYTPTSDDIYIAGSLNGWNSSGTKLSVPSGATDRNVVEYSFKMMAGKSIDYKYTRGSWDTEALTSHSRQSNDTTDLGNWAYSSTDTNMQLTIANQGGNKMIVDDYVLRWVDMPLIVSMPRISYGEDISFSTEDESFTLKADVPYGVAFTINGQPLPPGAMDAYGRVELAGLPLKPGPNAFELHIEPTAETLSQPWYTDKGRKSQATKTVLMTITRTSGGTSHPTDPEGGGGTDPTDPGSGGGNDSGSSGDGGNSSESAGSGGSPAAGGTGSAPGGKTKVVSEAELTTASGGKVTLELPAGHTALRLPYDAGDLVGAASLEIKGAGVAIQLPASVLQAAGKLLTADQAADAHIAIRVEQVDKSRTASLLAQSSDKAAAGLKAAGPLYRFTIEAVAGDGRTVKLESFKEPALLTFDIAKGSDGPLVGIYLLGDRGELEYLGGSGGQSKLTAGVSRFGTYAALEFDKRFEDVTAAHWASRTIKELAAKHIVSGDEELRFAPERTVSRAEFAAMLVRSLGDTSAIAREQGQTAAFDDVAGDKWYAPAVSEAVRLGIAGGRSSTSFAPEERITREEMAVMMVRVYGLLTEGEAPLSAGGEAPFADGQLIGEWAKPYVSTAAGLGLVQGKGDGVFDPSGPATRAESAQVIWNLLKLRAGNNL
ncbi:alpha-amylase family glycosyl hydrolase [Paenibacillus puerhi]|uniref:alpha-amylase family glycosyl hydrolase n=1 Tax=Paenibacillus puerhi TaxID=2692622 RepID=UPI001357AFBE|nr:alpha-amylase family glycosyl hydrolase [Paenibacillus puerhi]